MSTINKAQLLCVGSLDDKVSLIYDEYVTPHRIFVRTDEGEHDLKTVNSLEEAKEFIKTFSEMVKQFSSSVI